MHRAVVILSISTLATAATEFRTLDGTGNNTTNPDFGSAGDFLSRIAPANYADGLGAVDPTRVNPRELSNIIFDQPASVVDPNGLSEMVWAWGQFIDHDITLTHTDPAAGTLGISVPTDDPWFGDLSPNNTINVTRSEFHPDTNGVRQHVNDLTSWIDASNVYGGAASDPGRSSWLRANDGTGKLKTSDGGALGALLPKWDPSAPDMAMATMPSMGSKAYVAGDIRANEHTALLSMHTLFVREHNRLADLISSHNPALTGEQVFQRARKVVGAELQAITYNQFLPAIGASLDSYAGYNPAVDPAIATEFSTAAYRFHSMINGSLMRLDANHQVIPQGNLSLADAFFNPALLSEGGIDPVIRGLFTQMQESTDHLLVDALRNQLFQIFNPDTGMVDNATDLAAMNLMRGRDHGLGTYNQVRNAMLGNTAGAFSDITSDPASITLLEAAYGPGNVDDIDLYVGLLMEDDISGSVMGELGMAIVEDQFERLRDGDRFYFESNPDGANDDLLVVLGWDGDNEESAAEWLADLSLSDVINLNTGINTASSDPFHTSVIPEPSTALLFLLLALPLTRRRR